VSYVPNVSIYHWTLLLSWSQSSQFKKNWGIEAGGAGGGGVGGKGGGGGRG
jgi:hypothetical protein